MIEELACGPFELVDWFGMVLLVTGSAGWLHTVSGIVEFDSRSITAIEGRFEGFSVVEALLATCSDVIVDEGRSEFMFELRTHFLSL